MLKNTVLIKLFVFFSFHSVYTQVELDFKEELKPCVSVNFLTLEGSRNLTEKDFKKTLVVFQVYQNKVVKIPLIGNYKAENNHLTFTPQHNLGRGLEFEAQFYNNSDTIKKRFFITPLLISNDSLSRVIEVFPKSNQVPGNILLFYVLFSQPMKDEVLAFKHIKIIDSAGKEKEMPWRNKSQWINNKILVMMVHPARIKRGINSFAELGELFGFNKEYKLVITTELRDEFDRKLVKEYTKMFSIIKEDRDMPEIKYDEFKIPKRNTKESLVIKFNEGMDYLSVLSAVKIKSLTDNKYVEGEITYTDNDQSWNFIPKNNWQNIKYQVIFEKELADFSNNHVHRLFEITDLSQLNEENMPRKWNFVPKKN